MKPGFRASAVLLAAGEGARLGGRPKALIRIHGEPQLVRLQRALLQAGVADVLVVTGHQHERIAPVAAALGLRQVHNPAPQRGQQSSVRLGLEHADPQADVILMLLCDQPLLDAADLKALIEAFRCRPHGEFLLPRVAGERGNPVLLSRQARLDILVQAQDVACRAQMQAHPGSVWTWDTPNTHFVTDLDTEADAQALAARHGLCIELPAP